jgi:hypothetical protein
MWPDETVVPAARSEGLVVERLGSETLVYDLENDEAHHLNPTAAAVFELCDGQATVNQLTEQATKRLGLPVDSETVCEALEMLAAKMLLAAAPSVPSGVSRRDMVRQVAVVGAGSAFAGPLIKSIVAPTPAQAQTGCTQSGGVCDEFASDCCSGLVCCFPSCQSTQTICTAPGSCVSC